MSLVRAEFHVHTRYSKDSILNGHFILFMCKLKKIKLLAITDHNEIVGAIKYREFLKRHGIDVIVGEEIMTDSGEIIGLFLTKKILPMQTVEETIKQIKEQNGMVYLPHPYDEKRAKTVLKEEKQKAYKDEIDFVEVYNGRNVSEKYSKKQKEIQEILGIIPILGSDAHTFMEIGRNYMDISYTDIDDFRKNMQTIIKNATFHERKCIKFAHVITKFAKSIKMVERGDFGGLFRIVFKRR